MTTAVVTEPRVHNGLLWHGDALSDADFRDYEWVELPPRIPEEDVIASRGLCAGTQFSGFTDLSKGNSRKRNTAKRMCARCPVSRECRIVVDYLESNVEDPRWFTGLWAGEGDVARERRRKEGA